MPGFDYSKWDKIELSDDEDDVHPNIDKDSWFRLKHRQRVEKEEEDNKKRKQLEEKLAKLQREFDAFPEAAREHLKAQKVKKEMDEVQAELDKMDRERKWNADNMCKVSESRTEVVSAAKPAPAPEPRLKGEAIADGYVDYVEKHEDLLEQYIAMGDETFEKVMEFMKVHGGTLLEGEHAESYLLLDCLEKEMNDQHSEMLKSARQSQLLTQLREFSRASGRPARDGVVPVFERLIDHEGTQESFQESVDTFVKKIVARAPEKKKEMDKEMAEAEAEEAKSSGSKPLNPPGPGGLDPMEVFNTLPEEMQSAFRAKDIQRLQAALAALPLEEAKHHLKRCSDSGLWVPHQGPAEGDDEDDEDDED
mmetsp:Transcript_56994/g.121097  ORF Transcript_56994/g.121097 Transcript_56994/m.121097 type:complete len:364 (+) Transcript_56994:81-1172(+)